MKGISSIDVPMIEKIYELVKSNPGITQAALAHELGYKGSRSLRRTGDDLGLIRKATDYIYNQYRLFLFVDNTGVHLSPDPSIVEARMGSKWKQTQGDWEKLLALKELIQQRRMELAGGTQEDLFNPQKSNHLDQKQ